MENQSQKPQLAPDRVEVLNKIKEYERIGNFNTDVENDPPAPVLMPNEIDYLQKKLSTKFKRKIAYTGAAKFLKGAIKNRMLIIKEIKGLENWSSIEGGAVITSNHFNPMESFAMHYAYMQTGKQKKKRFYRVIREGNYTAPPGPFGNIMKYCDTLPLSSNKQTMVNFMRSVDTLLAKGNYVLIYPEQAMWWNYKKPRPHKDGAYKIAVRNNVPIVPVFITMKDSDLYGPDGYPIQEYTINVFKPIYPDPNKSKAQNIEDMLAQNEQLCSECYEKTYGIPLEYDTE
ncbi:MAG: 1-acyl-sn-glycerol-3-phosphate acyltransferase [Clostridia bacterium]|nr:1-acyl-sn-glycerol-3-phosphate acyltransferase [Clostridia bacterium]